MLAKSLSRRELLRISGLATAGAALAACQPKVVEKVVKETVVVEKEVEKQVEITKVVEKEVEKVITAAPAERQAAEVVFMYNRNEITDDEIAIFDEKYAPYKMTLVETDLTKLFSMLAAGNPVDVFRIYGTYVPSYVLKNVARDLTEYFEVSTIVPPSDLLPVNDLYLVNGRRYGMVKDWSPDVSIFANKSVFEEMGVPVPDPTAIQTYQEWRDLSSKLTKKEGDRTLIMGTDFTPNEHPLFWITTTFATPSHLFNEDFSKVRLLDSPETLEFVEWYIDWQKEKGLPSVINPHPSGEWSGIDWRNRSAAAIQFGYWFSGMAESDLVPGDDILMLHAPQWGPTYTNPCVTGCGALVTTSSRVPDAAWKAFEWYLGEEPAVNRAKSGWGVPGLKSQLPLMPKEEPWRKHNYDMVNWEIENSKVARMEFTPYTNPDSFKGAWTKYLEAVLKDEMPLEDMLANVEAEVNEAIQEGMRAAGLA